MQGFFLSVTLILGMFVLLCLYRGVFGPTVLDRLVSIGVIGTKTTVILAMMGFIYGRIDMFIDISLAYAMLNFITTLAAAKFFRVRKSILPGSKYYKERETDI